MSPTVLRTKNLRVVIYPKDHNPPHIHILGSDQEAKFIIETLECYYSRGFTEKALRDIKKYLEDKKSFLLEAWNEYQE